jgi:hypothetical protein
LDDLNPSPQAGLRRPPCRNLKGASVRIRVQDAADIDGLVAFFEERDYVAEQIGPNRIEVSRPSSVRHDHLQMELDLILRAWQAAHPKARAEFVE